MYIVYAKRRLEVRFITNCLKKLKRQAIFFESKNEFFACLFYSIKNCSQFGLSVHTEREELMAQLNEIIALMRLLHI